MKKILGILIMSLFVFWFWIYADVMPENSHWVSKCVSFQNTEIDDYRLVVVNKTVMDEEIYEPQAEKCLRGHYQFGASNQYLVEKSIPLDELNSFNIEEQAKAKWELGVNGYYVDNSDPLNRVRKQFKIINKDGWYELETVIDTQENWSDDEEILQSSPWTITDFLIALLITIFIETWVLFIIKNLNGLTYLESKDGTTNKIPVKNTKILLSWVSASAITLPLLRYVFPMFLWNGWTYVIGGELLVFLIEVVIIKYIMNISRKKAFVVSFVCNLVSFLFGILISYLWLFS